MKTLIRQRTVVVLYMICNGAIKVYICCKELIVHWDNANTHLSVHFSHNVMSYHSLWEYDKLSRHAKKCLRTYADSVTPDQPAHPRRLI